MSDVEDLHSPTATATHRPLDELAGLHGVQEAYVDVWGERRQVSDATKRGVLEAMGIACSDDTEIAASLERERRQRSRRLLEPVRVVEDQTPLWITLRVPETAREEVVHWQVVEEHGALHEGEAVAATLAADEDGAQRLELELELPTGYHQLEVRVADRSADMTLIVTPATCYLPEALANGERWWGVTAQLYGTRHGDDWGVGDFGSLAPLIDFCAARGGALVGLSPLHAMFPVWPDQCSPYSPSSRLFLNVLFIDLEHAADVTGSAAALERMRASETAERLEAVRGQALVDYRAVTALKMPVLELAFADFAAAPDSLRYRQFRRYCEQEGDSLLRHAVFEALQEHFFGLDPTAGGWPSWPLPYQDPASAAVARFCASHAQRMDFFRWLQWLADEQLAAAAREADDAELAVGLYLDLAVSVDKAGAEAWCNRHVYSLDASVGAPPDLVSVKGQDWGLPPLNPQALRESGYALFCETLRRNMRHAGALRIDHVMGLMRLYWIPAGCGADSGAYVSYPVDDLLRLVALESQRNRCMVIGEDLGTVPEGLFERLQALKILSYRLLWFEQESPQRFRKPEDYPSQALVAVSTHDLPTLAGWWHDRDLRWRAMLDLYPDEQTRLEVERQRAAEREDLTRALRESLPESVVGDEPPAAAVHEFLGRTPCMLMLVQIEDLLGVEEQANLPATIDEHPNWRRRLPMAIESLDAASGAAVLAVVTAERRGAMVPSTAPVLPRATYRLQLHAGFTFEQAREVVPYLAGLGISHAYASPYLQSRAGSTHGYDITDHSSIDSEIGSRQALADWVSTLGSHGMGHVLDIVPNHMGVMGDDNAWWLDVLEHGESAEHGRSFDIDWQPMERGLTGKVLLPVLGTTYGEALDSGHLVLSYDTAEGRFVVRYFEHLLPIDPRQYPMILDLDADPDADVVPSPPPSESVIGELESISAAFGRLPRRSETGARAVAERYRDAELLRARLLKLYREVPAVARHVESRVIACNAQRALHELLERQAWRLAHWRNASDEINYRRFFDINDLAGLRVEEPAVFEAVHARVLRLVEQGVVGGLRIDHPDGLYDPGGYFRRLRDRCAEVRGPGTEPIFLLVEKILAVDEALPEDWTVSGTTGYDFGATVNGLFVDPAGEASLTATYEEFVGERLDVADMAYRAKHLVMDRMLAGELQVLGNRLHRIAQSDFHNRDFTRNSLLRALREIVACFPVYRTYVHGPVQSDQDQAYLESAISAARQRSRDVDDPVFEFLGDVLLQRASSASRRRAMQDFTMRLQQFTAPVMAKGVEDTVFYRYARLLSLNEVGDEPARFGVSVEDFHQRNVDRLARWPDSLLATSTHDSKRGEDMRTRLDVLSEVAEAWGAQIQEWQRMNAPLVTGTGESMTPSANDQYFLYQTLVGCWPFGAGRDDHRNLPDTAALYTFRKRIRGYMVKAMREAKLRTSWTSPDESYEHDVAAFIDALLDPAEPWFLESLGDFVARIAPAGMINSLAQTALKLTVPGVPDIYQGSELWNFDLVDPDNRRPVDYRRRREMLAELPAMAPADLLARMADGLPKLHIVRRLLKLRARLPELFARGDYVQLPARGPLVGHLCAFARQSNRGDVLVVVPRLIANLCGEQGAPLGEVWRGTEVDWPKSLQPNGGWFVDVLSGDRHQHKEGERLSVERVLAKFPVAVLADLEALKQGDLV